MSRTPDWLVERLAAGELPEDAAASLRARLESEGRPPEEVLAALEASNRDILQALPPGPFVARVRARVPRPQRAGFLTAGLVALGATAVLAVVITREPVEDKAVAPLEETRIKRPGDPRLIVYRQTPEGHERLRDGAGATAGDTLQIAYVTGTEQWGVLVSLDGAGTAGLHLPPAGSTRAAQLEAAREVRLPFSYRLDQAPGFERFFLVTAADPFSPTAVLEAARTLAARGLGRSGALALPPGFRQSSFIVLKSSGGSP